MTEGLEAITTAALSIALDAAALRHQAIAANIANAGTEGYVPVKVSFEEQLEEARQALQSRGRLDASSLAGVQPALEPVSLGVAPKVMLDAQIADMSANTVHYQALVKGLSKHYAILSAAVSDGKK